jgi:type I restriction enzyme S subunit
MLVPGDLFVSLKGATKDGQMIGSVARVPSSVPGGRLTQDTVRLVFRAPDRGFEHYLYWLLRTPDYRDYCAGRATGSAVVALSRDDFLAYPVPSLTTIRCRIVEGLEGIERKIELNRRMSETLEAIARALFRSWFVNEPDASWTTAPLAEWVDVLSGGTPAKSNPAFWNGPLKWISPKSMTSIHADECDDRICVQAVGNGTRLAPKGATLVMVRGMGLHDGVRVSQAREDLTFNQDVKALVPKKIEPDLLLFAMLDAQQDLHKRVETSGHGTGKMPSEILLAHPITMPGPEAQRKLSVHFRALNDRIAVNRSEMRHLERLRDELLPRLFSGELPVSSERGLSMQPPAEAAG